MRTIEEVKEYVKDKWQKIEDSNGRGEGPYCYGCLRLVLEFIDSEPPCRHPRAYFCYRTPTVYKPEKSAWYLAGCGTTSDLYKLSYCPDCGEELTA